MEWLIPFLATSLSVGIGCQQDSSSEMTGPTEPPVQQTVGFEIEVSSLTAMPGDSVTLALAVGSDQEVDLAGVLGTMQLGRGKLALLGQVPDSGSIAVLNEGGMDQGALRILVLSTAVLDGRITVLAFRVLEPGYRDELSFLAEQATDQSGARIEIDSSVSVTLAAGLPLPSEARRLTERDWARFLGIAPDTTSEALEGPKLLGDLNDDREVNVSDAFRLFSVVVGSSSLPRSGGDDFLVADVTRDGTLDLSDAVLLTGHLTGQRAAEPIGEMLRTVISLPELSVDEGSSAKLNEVSILFHADVEASRRLIIVDSVAGSLRASVWVTETRNFTTYHLRWEAGAGFDSRQLALELETLPEVRLAYRGGFVSPNHEAPRDPGWNGWPSGPHAAELFWNWANHRLTSGANWAWKAAGLPLAWACSSESDVAIGVVDIGFTSSGTNKHEDLRRGEVKYHIELPTTGPFPRRPTPVPGPAPADFSIDHGLHVAGIIGADGDNGRGLTGVIWRGNRELSLYQARSAIRSRGGTSGTDVDIEDFVTLTDLALGRGDRVLNLSWGYRGEDSRDRDTYTELLALVLDSVRVAASDPLILISAGNESRDARDNAFPAVRDRMIGQDHVLVVGSTDRDFARSDFSNHGDLVEIHAPGEEIEVLFGRSGSDMASGTSFSTAFVTGAAALLWGFDPTLSAGDVKRYLIRGARAGQKKRELQGTAGTELVLNVHESLKLIAAERDHTPPCGMLAYTLDESIEFWAFNDTVSPVTAVRHRAHGLPWPDTSSVGFDLAHDFGSAYVRVLEGPGAEEVRTVYEYDFLNAAPPVSVGSGRLVDDFWPFAARSLTGERVLAAEIKVDADREPKHFYRLVEYANGRQVLMGDITDRPPLARHNPHGVSHDGKLYAFIAGDTLSHHVYIENLPASGGRGAPVFGNGGSADIELIDVVLSPRGDALAVHAASGSGDTYDNWIGVVPFETTVYESRSTLAARRLDIEHRNSLFDLRFTPAGDGVVVANINFDDPTTDHTCFLHHAGLDTGEEFVQVLESCRPPMLAPGTTTARRD